MSIQEVKGSSPETTLQCSGSPEGPRHPREAVTFAVMVPNRDGTQIEISQGEKHLGQEMEKCPISSFHQPLPVASLHVRCLALMANCTQRTGKQGHWLKPFLLRVLFYWVLNTYFSCCWPLSQLPFLNLELIPVDSSLEAKLILIGPKPVSQITLLYYVVTKIPTQTQTFLSSLVSHGHTDHLPVAKSQGHSFLWTS